MFGAANSLFSGLAFSGVVYAIILQRREIGIAKDELDRTKLILEKQEENIKIQNHDLKRQAFESTFFQLLRLLHEITDNIDLIKNIGQAGQSVTKGKDVFPVFIKRISRLYNSKTNLSHSKSERAIHAYEMFYIDHNTDLGHYFRFLYNILKYVDNTDIENKKFYTNLVRAQLSDAEVRILYMNALSEHGNEKMKPYVETYSMLKNLKPAFDYDDELMSRFSIGTYIRV
ncbi:MAG: hypothetical protein ED558_17500 [Oricola sp.]|nr:MAG: hypothetical protein ED558_17500 [Oricola sp.]